jgi:cell division protease FtsH
MGQESGRGMGRTGAAAQAWTRLVAGLRHRRKRHAAQGRKRGVSLVLLTLLLAEAAVFVWALSVAFSAATPGRALSLDEVTALAKQGRVVSATLRDADDRVVGRYQAARAAAAPGKPVTPASKPGGSPVSQPGAQGEFYADYPASGPLTADLYRTLAAGQARVEVDRQTAKQQLRLVTTFVLPLLILATVFALLLSPAGRGGKSAIGGVVDFSTVKNGRVKNGPTPVTFEDAGGVDDAVTELRELVDYLKNPAKYAALGAAPPKGVLLFGPPGCGKTLLAKAVAGEAGVPFFSVAGAEFVEALVGVGAARVRDLFARVRAAAPAIVFIDELDAAGRKRGAAGGSGGTDEREQTLNQLLVEMDGFEASKGIIVIAATNRPDILDPALRRPGRFDRHVTIERPDREGRLRILRIHSAGKPLDADVDLERIAERTPGFTGADLANVMNEAALLAIRESRVTVTVADLEEAIRRVLEGPKRRGHLMSEEEKDRAAHHEAGHVLVGLAQPGTLDVRRVSILGQGPTIATTELRDENAEQVLTEPQLRARLAVRMAGVAAERLAYGSISTGSERDLQEATMMARDIVARYGMSHDLGPSRLLGHDSASFLGDQTPWGDIAEETKAAADAAIRELLTQATDAAAQILQRNRGAFEYVARELREHETLEGELLHSVVQSARAQLGDGTRPARGRRTPVQRPVEPVGL